MKNIPWISSIPDHWERHRAKNMFFKQNRFIRDEDDVVTCFRDGTVTLRKNRRTTGFTESTQWSGYQGIRRGDLVIHVMDAFAGAIGVSDSDGKSTPVCSVCTAKMDLNNYYYAYLLREMARAGFIQSLYRGIRERSSDFRFEVFAELFLPLPPCTEQDQIVRFLDWKVSGINRLINAKRKQIALLQEKKQAVINTSLRKDESDKWAEKPLKHWVKSNQGSLSSNTDPDYEFDYLDISSVGHGFVKQKPTTLTFAEAPSRARRIVQYGDTIISTVRTYLRSVCFVDHDIENCIVSTGFSVLRPNKDIVMPELLSFALSADAFVDAVIMNSIGVSYPAINDTKLLNIKVSLPKSLKEQKRLYAIITEQFTSFDVLIAKVKKKITLLHEYRTRLISDVVTGKMDVRGVVVPDYEVVEEVADTMGDDLQEAEGDSDGD